MWHRPKEELLTYLKDRNIPEHIQTDFPQFVEFVNAFYRYIDQVGEPGEITSELIQYRSIDHTVDELVEFFVSEFMQGLPKVTRVQKSRIIKNAKDYYGKKGTDASLRYLFKAMFAEDISIYYPKNDMLIVSGSRWVEPDLMYVAFTDPSDPDVFDYETPEVWKDFTKSLKGKMITGELSGATARVVRAEFVDEFYYDDTLFNDNSPRFWVRLSLEQINGIFDDRDLGEADFEFFQVGDYLGVIYKNLTDISVTDAGVGYRIGDTFDITIDVNPPNGDTFSYVVEDFVTVRKLKEVTIGTGDITIINPGVGYNGDFRQVDNWFGLPINQSFEDSNYDYNGLITPISDFATLVPHTTVDEDGVTVDASSPTVDSGYGFTGTIRPIDPILTFIIGTGDTFDILDQIGAGRPGFGRILEVTSDGAIVRVGVLQNGKDIQLPRISINTIRGEGAEFLIEARGPIEAVKLSNTVVLPRFATASINYDTDVLTTLDDMIIVNGGSGFEGDNIFIDNWFDKPIALGFDYGGSPWTTSTQLSIVASTDLFLISDTDTVTADSVEESADSGPLFTGTARPLDEIYAIDPSGTADTFTITDDSGFGTPASGFVSLVDVNGTILEFTLTTPGANIVDPVLTITTDYGSGEEIILDTVGRFGGEFDITFKSVGTGFGYYDPSDIRGHISDKNKIQDSFYYQDYSYDIKTSKLLSEYETALNSLFHPAGQKQFGSIDFAALVDLKEDDTLEVTS